MSREQPQPSGAARLGTFGGVFTPSILTILGVILFMRAGFVVGTGGVVHAVLILLLAKLITFCTALSMSAVATNMTVRGGGAYYLISRVLGPEFGGAIGIAQYAALAISVPFYVLGFTEAIVVSIPALEAYTFPLALVLSTALLGLAWVGADLVIRTQYVVMGILAVGLLALLGGAAMLFDPELLRANMTADYAVTGERTYGFWLVFAIYFPAVTGIDAGVNMSGDLKDPAKSIPRGTITAVVVGFAVYLLQIVLIGGAFDRQTLADQPYQVLVDNAAFGLGFAVVAGVLAATISSALGSCLGAPRVLQAVARDKAVPGLGPFAQGSGPADEPRRALIVTSIVATAVLVWALKAGGEGGGALNLVAGLITMFFLAGYGMTNLAAFTEAFGNNPSFRPRFRFFHWASALVGAAGCGLAAFLIAPLIAAVAFALIALLLWYLRRREMRRTYADARRGYVFSNLRRNLLKLDEMAEDARNWRPSVLVFSGNPNTREGLVSWGVWLESGRGLVVLANVLKGDLDKDLHLRDAALRQLRAFCQDRHLHAFPLVVMAEDLRHGTETALQAAGFGPIRPNLVLRGWSNDPEQDDLPGLRLAARMDMALVLLGGTPELGPPPIAAGARPRRRRIDVWWRGRKNGALMVMLAHLTTRNWEWSRTTIRLMRVVGDERGVEPARLALQQLVETARIDATAEVLPADRPFREILAEQSGDADCVLLGFELPEQGDEAAWQARYGRLLEVVPTALLVSAPEGEDLLV